MTNLNDKSVTPVSASKPLLIVPMFVPPFGPQLSRLPDELLAEIFKIIVTTMFPSTSRFHMSINPKNFDILNRHYAIDRLRRVSKAFYAFFTQAFYENFTFSFITKPLIDLQSKYLTSIPTPLPRPSLRHHLRSIHIQIVLENSFFTPGTRHPACHDAARRISREITSATQLFTFCPAARRLRYLTNPEMGGFGGLRFLYVAIRTDFKYLAVSEQFLRALEEANFVLRARNVVLEVTGDMGVVGADQEEVRKRIVIE
ncbi:hypothetical protein N0V94_006635 [Neodidymelliopsis sp. IMI 364377]|nr:hypothetical protein N0V94_006635 [Neodidymelliopsis sp. IMI 364377]